MFARVLWYAFCTLSLVLVFTLTLLLGWPLQSGLARLPLPADLQLQGAQGSLLAGAIERLSGPGWQVEALRWEVQPGWPLRLHSELEFSGQGWQLEGRGWPWQWQAQLQPQSRRSTPMLQAGVSLFAWQGLWQGQLQLQGRYTQCVNAGGSISSENLTLTAPVLADFGRVALQLQCGAAPRLQVESRGVAHQLSFNADLQARRSRLRGEIAPDSALAQPATELGLLKAGQAQVQRGWRW